MMRPTTSRAPPAGKGAMMRIGFVGYWANALVASSAVVRAKMARPQFMSPPRKSLRHPPVQFAPHVRFRRQEQARRSGHPRDADPAVRHLGDRVLYARLGRARRGGGGERLGDHAARVF